MEQFLRCDAAALETVVRWIEHGNAASATPRAVSLLSVSSPVYADDLEASTAGAAYSGRGRESVMYSPDEGDAAALDSKSVSSLTQSATDLDPRLPKVPISLFCLWVLNYVRNETRALLAEQAQSAKNGGQPTHHVFAGLSSSDAHGAADLQLPSSPSFHERKRAPSIVTSPSKVKAPSNILSSPAAVGSESLQAWPPLSSDMGASTDKPKRRIRTTLLRGATTTAATTKASTTMAIITTAFIQMPTR